MDDVLFENLWRDFLTYLSMCYGVRIEVAKEDPHFLTFLEHLVDRPVRRNGGRMQFPIRKTLGLCVRDLRTFLRRRRHHFQLSNISIAYADELSRPYRRTRPGARSVRPEDVEKMSLSLDENNPWELRLKAASLIVWHAWARPKEILSRLYPQEIDSNHRFGIVIIVPRSKANSGERSESFFIRHDSNQALCAVCCLHKWIQWLGPSYAGPLFPTLDYNGNPKASAYRTDRFSRDLSAAFVRAGVKDKRYTSYSLRKGQATQAAADRMPLDQIKTRLRHRSFAQSLVYVDSESLFEIMESPLE